MAAIAAFVEPVEKPGETPYEIGYRVGYRDAQTYGRKYGTSSVAGRDDQYSHGYRQGYDSYWANREARLIHQRRTDAK